MKKPADIAAQSPLDVKPMMVLVEDKQDDIKQKYFYDQVPVGGKIRVFGSVTKFDENPTHLAKEKKAEAIALLSTFDPEQLVPHKANNYRRWFGTNWALIEKGGETGAGDWTPASEARLKKFVDYGHRLGYFVGIYCLDGYADAENQGWDKDYNFGPLPARPFCSFQRSSTCLMGFSIHRCIAFGTKSSYCSNDFVTYAGRVDHGGAGGGNDHRSLRGRSGDGAAHRRRGTRLSDSTRAFRGCPQPHGGIAGEGAHQRWSDIAAPG